MRAADAGVVIAESVNRRVARAVDLHGLVHGLRPGVLASQGVWPSGVGHDMLDLVLELVVFNFELLQNLGEVVDFGAENGLFLLQLGQFDLRSVSSGHMGVVCCVWRKLTHFGVVGLFEVSDLLGGKQVLGLQLVELSLELAHQKVNRLVRPMVSQEYLQLWDDNLHQDVV